MLCFATFVTRQRNCGTVGPARPPRTVEETNITLPDGSKWLSGAELRDNFHLTDYAAADLPLATTWESDGVPVPGEDWHKPPLP